MASTVEKGGPLAPSATMAIELVRIRTAQQYPTLMPTLFPGDRASREKPYVSLASMWTTFADLKHNTSPAINGDAFASAPQASCPHAPPIIYLFWRPLLPYLTAITAAHRDHHKQYQMFHLFTLVGIPFASIMASGPSMTKITRLFVL